MQPASLAPGSLTTHPLHPAAALMPPTAGPNVSAGAVGLPLLPLPTGNPLQDRLQSHYAASTSASRSNLGFEFAGNALRPSVAPFTPQSGVAWPLVPPAATPAVLPAQPPLPAPHGATQPTHLASKPPQALLQQPGQHIQLQQQQQQQQQLHWQLQKELTAALPPEVPPPTISLPPPAARRLPEDVIASFCRRLEQNKIALAAEEDQHRRTDRDLQEATAVLRRAEQLPKLQAAVWSFLDENDVICGPYSLLQLTALLKGAPQTQVENSETGESVPFMDAIAATPLRTCVLERNTLRERLATLEGSIWLLLAEGRAICLEVQAAEFASLADYRATARWFPAGPHGTLYGDGLTPAAIRSQLIAGSLAPDAMLLPATHAALPPAASAVQAALTAAAEVVSEWEGALHDAQERRAAAAEAASKATGRAVQGLQPPAKDAKAWTYLSGGRTAAAVSCLELLAGLEAGSLDKYTLVAPDQSLAASGPGAGAVTAAQGGGDGSTWPRWLLAAELVRLYGGQVNSAGGEPAPPSSFVTAPPDPMFAPGGVQQLHVAQHPHPVQMQVMPLLPQPPPQPLQATAAMVAAVSGVTPHAAGAVPPLPYPAHPGMLSARSSSEDPMPAVPVAMPMGMPMPAVMSAGSLPITLPNGLGNGWVGDVAGVAGVVTTAPVLAGPAPPSGQPPGSLGGLRARANSASGMGAGPPGEDVSLQKQHPPSRQGSVNGRTLTPLLPAQGQQQPAHGHLPKQQGKQGLRSQTRLPPQRSVSPASPPNAQLAFAQLPTASSAPLLAPLPLLQEQPQQQKEQQQQPANKLAIRLGPQSQVPLTPPPPLPYRPPQPRPQQPSPPTTALQGASEAAACSAPSAAGGADAPSKAAQRPFPPPPPPPAPSAHRGGSPALPSRPTPPATGRATAVAAAAPPSAPSSSGTRPSGPASAAGSSATAARGAPPSVSRAAPPSGPLPSAGASATRTAATTAPAAPAPATPAAEATQTARASEAPLSGPTATLPRVDSTVVSQCVRMTRLQFLQHMRPHLQKLLAVMVEDAYCDYRLRLLEREEEETGLREQAPPPAQPQGQQAPAVPEKAPLQVLTSDEVRQQSVEAPPIRVEPAELQPSELPEPEAQPCQQQLEPKPQQQHQQQPEQQQQQLQQQPVLLLRGADWEPNEAQQVLQDQVQELPHALSPDLSDKEQTLAAAPAPERVRWSEAAPVVGVVAADVEGPPSALKVQARAGARQDEEGTPEVACGGSAVAATAAAAAALAASHPMVPAVKHEPEEQAQEPGQQLGLVGDAERRDSQGKALTLGRPDVKPEELLVEAPRKIEVVSTALHAVVPQAVEVSAGALPAFPASASARSPQPRRSSRVNKEVTVAAEAPVPAVLRERDAAVKPKLEASAVVLPAIKDDGSFATAVSAAGETAGAAAAATTPAAAAAAGASAGGGGAERAARLSLARDMLDEIIGLAFFMVEAQSLSAPAIRSTRSRRQAPVGPLAAAGGSTGKTRREAAAASVEEAAGHPPKRQRQGHGKAAATSPPPEPAPATATAGGSKVRAIAAGIAASAGAEEVGGDTRRRKVKSRERLPARPSLAVSESDDEATAATEEGKSEKVDSPTGPDAASHRSATDGRQKRQQQPRLRPPQSSSQSPGPGSTREQQQQRPLKRACRESQTNGGLEVDIADEDKEATAAAAATGGDSGGSSPRQEPQRHRRGSASVDAKSAGVAATDSKDGAAAAAGAAAADADVDAGQTAAVPAVPAVPAVEASADADGASAGDGVSKGSRDHHPAAPSPRRPRAPRHRGISAKELRSLALDTASVAAPAVAVVEEPGEVAGLLGLRGAGGDDPAPGCGRRTRAAAAAAAVNAIAAAMAAEALASMGGGGAASGSLAAVATGLRSQHARDWDAAKDRWTHPQHLQQQALHQQQQLSPTRGSSETTGTAATGGGGDDDHDPLGGVSPFMETGQADASCFRRGGARGMRSKGSLDNLAAEAELAAWQAATTAGHASRRGSDSGRRPPSRTSSCTQEHLEGIWHSAVCPGQPYGKAMRHDSLTMLLEVSLMTFAEEAASAGASAAVVVATADAAAVPADAVAAGVVLGAAAADNVTSAAAGGSNDDGSDEFGGGAPCLPKHARGPRSARTTKRRSGSGAVLAAVLDAPCLDLAVQDQPPQQPLQQPPYHHPGVVPEGRRRRQPPVGGGEDTVVAAAAAAGGLMGGLRLGLGLGPGPMLELGQPALKDEEPPGRPWGEGRLTRQRRNGATTPPLQSAADGGGPRQGAAVGGGRSTRRNGGSSRPSPLPGGGGVDSAPAAPSGCGGRYRAATPASGVETGAVSDFQQLQPQQHHQGTTAHARLQPHQQQQLLRHAALCLLEGPSGCSRGLPLPAMLALARSRSNLASPRAGGSRPAAGGAASAAIGSGAGTTGPPPPHPHPRARAAASEHRFLTMAAAGGAAGGGGGGGSGGVSAEQQQVMEVAKWRLQAARAKKLKFGRSRIAGWGLFAVEPIEPSEFVIEYCGELIRKPLDDVRQREYDAAGFADYMFTVDDSRVVDATVAGNAARFINHCCDPNCVARIVEVGGERRIAIYTLRRVEAGEELHYDYKLSGVPGAERIPCGCGARNCKGFMN